MIETSVAQSSTHLLQDEGVSTVNPSGGEEVRRQSGSMIGPGESRQEAGPRMKDLLTPKVMTRIGTWNVRTLFETSKLGQALKEMEHYNLDLLGISECRWTGSGRMTSQGHTILHSGHDSHHVGGVALIINKKLRNSLIEWHPVDNRIIVARFNSKYAKVTVIQIYSPTNQAEDEEKDKFYDNLQKITDKIPRHDVTIIMGDANAKVGNDNEGEERTLGKHGVGTRNENGQRFVDFCTLNNHTIGGTIFQHKEIHKVTWTSPNKEVLNQIDHFTINNKWRSSLQDVRSYRGADINSDHFLVIGKIKLKLRSAKKK